MLMQPPHPLRSDVLVAHQPAYLPWQGYFSRLLDVDQLVLLDHVQFAERGRQHRNLIRAPGGGTVRLTVPVQRRFGQPIEQVRIADGRWARRHWRSIKQSYRRAHYWPRYAPALADIYSRDWRLLMDLDIALTRFALDVLGLTVHLVRSSTLAPTGAKTDMLVDLCRKLGTSTLRIGTGGSCRYLDPATLAAAGIAVEVAGYTHPAYHQGHGPFTAGLAVLDLILHQGPSASDVLREGSVLAQWEPGDDR
jgi:hypothetical protein